MEKSGFDPRSVANFLLDTRDSLGRQTTQIELQKLLFFAHESYLLRLRRRLVVGYFEAWQYGPVHPTIYRAFSDAKGSPITNRAAARNIHTGQAEPVDPLKDEEAMAHVRDVVMTLVGLNAGQLIELSHVKGGPWHSTVESAKYSVALGLRITDDVILSSRSHTILNREGQSGVPNMRVAFDETPFTRDRSR